METEGERYRLYSRRALLIGGLQGVLTAALLGRLYYLGVIESGQYKMLAEENRVSLRFLAPERGEILDRAGRVLATNRRDYRVFLVPEQAGDVEATLGSLKGLISLSDSQIKTVLKRIKRQRSFQPVSVAENLDWETFAKLNVASINLAGVQPDAGQTRYYPLGEVVSHVVGYVGPVSEDDLTDDPVLHIPGIKIGRAGLEKTFDQALRGQAGSRRLEVNAYGRVVRELTRQEGLAGDDLVLTVDLELQKFASERLGEKSAAAVVLGVDSGDILVQASTPAYDSNHFNLGFSREEWEVLVKDPRKPLINKCLSAQYPPGSTFKMIVALAALEAGVIDDKERFRCNGEHKLGNRIFHCWKKRGHGRLALVDAIAQSCDIYFYQIAQRVGIDRIAEMARRLGFGRGHPIGIGSQASGLVPDKAWKRRVMGERWQLGETLIAGIGQGALLATPLQLAVMTSRIAGGGAASPRIVRALGDQPMPTSFLPGLAISEAHLELVREGMAKVMEPRGTAFASRIRGRPYKMAGKTGTSQVRRITEAQREAGLEKLKERPWVERDHALFVGYAPVENPRYVISVVVEHGGGGGTVAAPMARDIMMKTLEAYPPENPSDPEVAERATKPRSGRA